MLEGYTVPLSPRGHGNCSVSPHVTFGELKGVSLFAGRTILSGRGDELVDLARDNLR